MMSPKYCEVLQGVSRQHPSQEDIHIIHTFRETEQALSQALAYS